MNSKIKNQNITPILLEHRTNSFHFPETENDTILFLAIGGCEEVGMNTYAYGYKNKWIIVDFGIGFVDSYKFPGVEIKTVDPYILSANKDKICAVIITHAHEDHIGAIPIWADHLPRSCPVFATSFARSFLQAKITDRSCKVKLDVRNLPNDKKIRVGPFMINSVLVKHSIPESQGLIIQTEQGSIIHTGDWRKDKSKTTGYRKSSSKLSYQDILNQKDTPPLLAIVGDSTNSGEEHETKNEEELYYPIKQCFAKARQRLIVTGFASNLQRVLTLIKAGKAVGRKPCLIGRSLWRIWDCALQSGLVSKNDTPLHEDKALEYQDKAILFIVTGCQGESRAILTRIANRNFNKLGIIPGDTVVFSSSIIPGNESAINEVENALAKQGVIIERSNNYHSSGHANSNSIVALYNELKPPMVIPVHGEVRHLLKHANLAISCRVKHVVIPKNGSVIVLNGKNVGKTVSILDSHPILLDGNVFVKNNALRFKRRFIMAHEGECVVSIHLDSGRIKQEFLGITLLGICDYGDESYGDESQEESYLIKDSKAYLYSKLKDFTKNYNKKNNKSIASYCRKELRRFIFQNYGKKPEVTVHIFNNGGWHCYSKPVLNS